LWAGSCSLTFLEHETEERFSAGHPASREPLTYELHGLVQPGQDFLAEAVVDGDAQEVCLRDEVWLGAGVAGVQDEGDVLLPHQLLKR